MPHLHTDNTWVVYEWELVPRFYNTLKTLQQEIHRYRHRVDGAKKIQSGGNGRNMLISFDSLRPDIKEAIGDPRRTDNPLQRFYVSDPDAALFFTTYTFNDGTTLTPEQQDEYTRNANTLQAVITLIRERGAMRGTQRNIMPSISRDLEHFKGVMENHFGKAHTLACSAKSIKRYLAGFQTAFEYRGRQYDVNYASLIPGNIRNQNAAKIKKDTVSVDILQTLLEHGNQYDDRYIQIAYNKKIKEPALMEQGLKEISMGTVALWRRKLEPLLKPFREGWNDYKDAYSRSVKRQLPSQPGYIWESDDNHMDLLFQGDDGKPYHRFKGIFVQDSFNNLVLGYSCVEGELTWWNVRLAYINAMYYVRKLTGGWYLPWEVRTDRWRLSQLRPFYKSLAHYHDTPVLSKNRGWQETFFGSEDWKRCMKTDVNGLPANNYSGNNITAKNRGHNRELLKLNEKLFPTTQEAPFQIEAFVNRLRRIDFTGKGNAEMRWLEAWSKLPDEEKRPISDMEFMKLFGIKHEWQNTIEKTGITPTIMGIKMSYSVPPAYYLQNVGKKMDVYYDPFDLRRVFVTDGERVQFMANEMTPVPGTMRDMHLAGEGSRAFLNQILDEKKADVDYIVKQREERLKRLDGFGLDPETMLSLNGMIPKELGQEAEMAYISNDFDGDEDNSYEINQM